MVQDEITFVSRTFVKNALADLENYVPTAENPNTSIWSDGDYDEPSTHRWFINDKEYFSNCDMYNESELLHLLKEYANGETDSNFVRVECSYNDGCC